MKARKLTDAQNLLRTHLAELGHECVPEWQFCEGRKWRFDLFCGALGIGFEVDGGKWHGGHRRGNALEQDYEKQNMAQLLGFRILRFTNQQVLKGEALAWLRENL